MIESFLPMAISTSGDSERFVEVEGKRINHIFDPRTGHCAQYYRSVTVIASDPVRADIWSTTLFAMSPDRARVWAEARSIPVLFLPASGTTWLTNAGEGWFKDLAP